MIHLEHVRNMLFRNDKDMPTVGGFLMKRHLDKNMFVFKNGQFTVHFAVGYSAEYTVWGECVLGHPFMVGVGHHLSHHVRDLAIMRATGRGQ